MIDINRTARLNTAEHIFFRVLINNYQCKPKGLNINEDSISLRVGSPLELDKIDALAFESKVQKIIDQNLEVKKYELSRNEVTDVDLSLPLQSVKKIRIVEIVGFDKQACLTPVLDNNSMSSKRHFFRSC